MTQNIRIAMLGTGFIAEFRTQVYAQLKGADVVAVMGRNSERTRNFAEVNGIGFAATTFEELLGGADFLLAGWCRVVPGGSEVEKFATLRAVKM